MSITGAIGSFSTGTYAVTRTLINTLSAGVAVPGATSALNIDASIQPLKGAELQALPEGHHSANTKLLLTKTEIHGRTPTHAPDKVTYKSETWTVFQVELWEFGAETWYEAMITRLDLP